MQVLFFTFFLKVRIRCQSPHFVEISDDMLARLVIQEDKVAGCRFQ